VPLARRWAPGRLSASARSDEHRQQELLVAAEPEILIQQIVEHAAERPRPEPKRRRRENEILRDVSRLGDEHAHEPAARGAQCRAHRGLPHAVGRACEQEVRDVRAGDQEHETDCDQERPDERRAVAADESGRRGRHLEVTIEDCPPDLGLDRRGNGSQLLLCDEATVGLDVRSRANIMSDVRSLVRDRGMAVLWATHLIDEVEPDRMVDPEVRVEAVRRRPGAEAHAAHQIAAADRPERQRAAIGLVHYQGLSNAEAAEVLGVGVRALESLLARARRELRDTLAELAPSAGKAES